MGHKFGAMEAKVTALAAVATFALFVSTQAGATLSDGLVGYYPFDGNANDASGNNNDGTLFGGVSLTSDRFGASGSAFLFDGATGYIQVVGSSSVLNLSSALTLSAWVWHTPGNLTEQAILNKSDAGNVNLGYRLAAWWANPLGNALELYDQAEVQHIVDDGLAPSSGVWELVTGTWEGSTMSIYRNGVLQNTGPFSGVLGTASQDLYIGAIIGFGFLQQFFDGAIDDVRIYDRALSATEVRELWQLSTSVAEPTTLVLLATGLAGFAFRRRKQVN